MNILYIVLTGILLVFFLNTLRKLMRVQKMVTPLIGWMVGLFYFIIIPLTLIVWNDGYEIAAFQAVGEWGTMDLNDSVYFFPFIVIWTALMLTAFVVQITVSQKFISSRNWQLSIPRLKRVFIGCSVMVLIDIVIKIVLVGGISNYFNLYWYTRHEGSLAQFGEFFVLYQYIGSAIQILLTAVSCLIITAAIRESLQRNVGILLWVFFMVILNMIMTGNRIFIALLILYCLIMLFSERQYKLLLFISFLLPVGIILFSAWAQIRGGLDDPIAALENYIESSIENESELFDSIFNATEGSNVMILMCIIKDFGSKYDFLLGETYTKAITFVIPRSFYPNKIEPFTMVIGKIYEPNIETSLSSTVLGEMYANFGIFSILTLPMFTWGIQKISRWTTTRFYNKTLLSTVLFLMFIWMSRSIFAENFLIILFCIILITSFGYEKDIVRSTVND